MSTNRSIALLASPINTADGGTYYNVTVADPTNTAEGGAVYVTLHQQHAGGASVGAGAGVGATPGCAKQVIWIQLPTGWSAGRSVTAASVCAT